MIGLRVRVRTPRSAVATLSASLFAALLFGVEPQLRMASDIGGENAHLQRLCVGRLLWPPGALAVSSVGWLSQMRVNTFSKSLLVRALNGGPYWHRTSGPCRLKA